MSLAKSILATARELPEGSPLTAKALLHLGGRNALNQALLRLARRGELLRAEPGLYLLPVKGRFGSRPPAAEKVVRALAAVEGEQVTENGAAAANLLGLTEQVPMRAQFFTSGRPHHLELGGLAVEMKRMPRWQMALPGSSAGRAIRALFWLGPQAAPAAADVLMKKLAQEERARLRTTPLSRMPGWLAAEIARLAHG